MSPRRPARRRVAARCTVVGSVVVATLLLGLGPTAVAQDATTTTPAPSTPAGDPAGSPGPDGADGATPTPTPGDAATSATPPDLPDTPVGTGTSGDGLALSPTLPAGWPAVPRSTARAIMAVDTTTGQVLAAENVDERFQVASTIKLLTVLTALDLMDPDDLVAGALIRSGNDAAEVLAVAGGGGDRDAFIAAMNDMAASLGITGATIADPTGLEDVNLLSARDLVTIGRAALADPLVAEIAASRFWDLPSTGVVPNRNLLLEQREDATGLKTGTTDLAGASLVASVRDPGPGAEPDGDADAGAVNEGSEQSPDEGGDTTANPTSGDGAHDIVVALLAARSDSQRYAETNAVYDWIEADLARHPVQVGARVRVPGAWVGEVVDVDLWSPQAPVVATEVAIDGTSVVSEVSMPGGGRLGEYVATSARAAPTSMGQSLAGTLYDALRQADELGLLAR